MALRPIKTAFVKNLSLETTDAEFLETFKQFGTIKQAFIVKDKSSGGKAKSRGFGYVIFADAEDCKKCVSSKINLAGNKLNLSFAKPKVRENDRKGSDDIKGDQKKGVKIKHHNDDDDGDEEEEEDDSNDVNEEGDDDDDEGDDKGEEDTDGEEENDEEEDDDNEEDDDDNEDDDHDDEDDDHDDDSEELPAKKSKPERPLNNKDAEDGRTIFIRNLSFDSTEDDLDEFFEEFGALQYCRVVVDQKSQRSKGVAFVRFRSKEDAERCLEEFKNDGNKFVVSGRKLNLTLAVTKEKVKDMSDQIESDKYLSEGPKRNLHLIRLTMVRPGTKAAEGLSKDDLDKRAQVEAIMKKKLKNPNIFVSSTRLCVRNIPVDVDDKKLRGIYFKAAGGNKSIKITECKIMRDMTRPNASGICKSKGFGFVNFSQHEHALAAALATNNNPEIFNNKRRLIVEFSLENKAVYELKQKRLQKSKGGNTSKDKRAQKFKYPMPVPNSKPNQKVLPSHQGPKIRHKSRTEKPKKTKKVEAPAKPQQQQQQQQKKRKRKAVPEQRDDLDVMINKRRRT